MPSPIPGPIPLATETQQGQVSIAGQTFGGAKLFPQGAAAGIYDARNFGAVADSTLVANDAAAAVAAAQAAGATAIYFPTGSWVIGSPILNPGNLSFIGDGPDASVITINPSAPSVGQTPCFAGPIFMVAPAQGYYPGRGGYAAALIGSGYSLNIGSAAENYPYSGTQFMLHGSPAWSKLSGLSEVAIQFFVNVTAFLEGSGGGAIISSGGLLTASIYASCFSLVLEDQGGGLLLSWLLTTTGGTYSGSSTPGGISYSTTTNFELNYNGSFIDIFIAGTNVAHVAATGTLVQEAWEGVSIGGALQYGPEAAGVVVDSINGQLDSLRLSNIARHTGTGSFVPPAVKYTFDPNTLALWNFDQGTPPLTQPWIIGQVQNPFASAGTPMLHYAHFNNGNGYASFPVFENIGFNMQGTTEGVVCVGGAWGTAINVTASNGCKVGFGVYSGESFGWSIFNLRSNSSSGVGLDLFNTAGTLSGIFDIGSAIGISLAGGNSCQTLTVQPPENESLYVPVVLRGGGGSSYYSPLQLNGLSIDFEGNFPNCVAGMMIDNSMTTIRATNWSLTAYVSVNNARTVPAVLFDGNGNLLTFENCFFDVNDAAGKVVFGQYLPGRPGYFPPISIKESILGQVSGAPTALQPGWLIFDNIQQRTGLLGLSTSGVAANNMAGTFTILHGYTSGGPTFTTPEVDGNYLVTIKYMGYVGSSPAAGSTTEDGPYTTGKNGFTFNQGTDPAGTCMTMWSYTITRTLGPADYYSYLPTIPSTPTNPISGTGDWAVGVTLVPASGNVIGYDTGVAAQTIVEAGTPSTNWWTLLIVDGAFLQDEAAATTQTWASYVNNGQLAGILNPGSNNVAMSVISGYLTTYVNGIPTPQPGGTHVPISAGTQQTPIYVGEHSDTTQALTTATLRNLKVDTIASQVITYEQDAGPQTGNSVAAFFGEAMTMGLTSTSSNGGFATQIASNRYGTTYYWMAVNNFATTLPSGVSIVNNYWNEWGALQTGLSAICVFTGFNDLLNGAQATDVLANLELMVNGSQATVTYVPPTAGTFPPYDDYTAWAEFLAAATNTGGSGTITINGRSFPWTIAPNALNDPTVSAACINALVALINADAPTTAIVTPMAFNQGPSSDYQTLLILTAVSQGTGGNGISLSLTDPSSTGAGWYPPTATAGGQDVNITIDGITLTQNFDTDADTTVNDLIAQIAANGTLNALVTGTLVNHQMLLTANSAGSAGNSIVINSNQIRSSGFVSGTYTTNPLTGTWTMQGGSNGAIQNGIGTIVLCNCPPFGQAPGYTMAKNTQRTTFNTNLSAFCTAHSAMGVVLADTDVTLRDPAAHQNIDAAYLAADNTNLTNAGHTALYGLISPLLP